MFEASDEDRRVQQIMEAALEMLDTGNYPAEIGAHLDLALCRLREHLARPIVPINLTKDGDTTGLPLQ